MRRQRCDARHSALPPRGLRGDSWPPPDFAGATPSAPMTARRRRSRATAPLLLLGLRRPQGDGNLPLVALCVGDWELGYGEPTGEGVMAGLVRANRKKADQQIR